MLIFHIISGLSAGGAERNLYNICTNNTKNNHIVVSLTNIGEFGKLLKQKNIEVFCFNLKSKLYFIKNLYLLYKLIAARKPDIVQTWLYHADLIGGLIAKLAGCNNIYWNLRQSKFLIESKNKFTYNIILINSKISSWLPKKIICNSSLAKRVHINLGYDSKKFKIIYNGVDTNKFYINSDIKKKFRKKYRIKKNTIVLGCVGRNDPYKDIQNLIVALSILKLKNISFVCIIVGKDFNKKNKELVNLITNLSLKKNIYLWGYKKNIAKIMNCLDLFILSSKSESFPNVIIEAMSCGVPCVATNVGDVKKIILNKDLIVKPNSSNSLALAILNVLKKRNKILSNTNSRAINSYVVKNYNLKKMIKNYENAWGQN
jgi:glycosyltransferase involved in cell wall biosynthesis